MNTSIAERLLSLLFNEDNTIKDQALALLPEGIEEGEEKSYLLNTLTALQLPALFIAENATSFDKRLLVVEGHYEDIIITNDYAGFADMIIDIYLQDGQSDLDEYIISAIFNDNVVSEFVKVNLVAEMLTRVYKKIGLIGSGSIEIDEEDKQHYLHSLIATYETLFELYGSILIMGYEQEMIEYESLESTLMDWAWLLVGTMASHIQIPSDVCARLGDSLLAFSISKIDDATMIRNMIKLYDNCKESVTLEPFGEGPGESLKLAESVDRQIVIAADDEPRRAASILVANDSIASLALMNDNIPTLFPYNRAYTVITIDDFNKEKLKESIIIKSVALVKLNFQLTKEIANIISDVALELQSVIIIDSFMDMTESFDIKENFNVVYNETKLIKNRFSDKELPFPTVIDTDSTTESKFSCKYDAELVYKILKETMEVSEGYLYKVHEVGEYLASIIRRDYSELLNYQVIFELTVDDVNQFYINDDQIVFVLNIDEINDDEEEDISIIANSILDDFDVAVLTSLGIKDSPRKGYARKLVSDHNSIIKLKEELFRLRDGAMSFNDMADMDEEAIKKQIDFLKSRLEDTVKIENPTDDTTRGIIINSIIVLIERFNGNDIEEITDYLTSLLLNNSTHVEELTSTVKELMKVDDHNSILEKMTNEELNTLLLKVHSLAAHATVLSLQ